MEPAFVCAGDLFNDDEEECDKSVDLDDGFTVREHQFPGMTLKVREFIFHEVNANLLWPGSCVFAQWLVDHRELLHNRRILELGSGTGALAIFLRMSLGVDITTCDFDDEEIEKNIAHNCEINDIAPLPHIRHTWGEPKFPVESPSWDLIIASDILLYVKQYENLIKTLEFLLKTRGEGGPRFLMSWRRRIPKEDETVFFNGCKAVGFQVEDLGSRVYCISNTM